MAFEWNQLLSVIAPTVATALGGPLAGMAVKTLSTALLGNDAGSEKEIEAAMLGATSEQLLAVKTAEQTFVVKMRELEIDVERVNAEDRTSARQMQVETRSWIPGTLAMVVTLGYFGALGVMLKWGLPKEVAGNEALLLIMGGLTTAFGALINFYFGSSVSSRAKDETLHASIRNGK